MGEFSRKDRSLEALLQPDMAATELGRPQPTRAELAAIAKIAEEKATREAELAKLRTKALGQAALAAEEAKIQEARIAEERTIERERKGQVAIGSKRIEVARSLSTEVAENFPADVGALPTLEEDDEYEDYVEPLELDEEEPQSSPAPAKKAAPAKVFISEPAQHTKTRAVHEPEITLPPLQRPAAANVKQVPNPQSPRRG